MNKSGHVGWGRPLAQGRVGFDLVDLTEDCSVHVLYRYSNCPVQITGNNLGRPGVYV